MNIFTALFRRRNKTTSSPSTQTAPARVDRRWQRLSTQLNNHARKRDWIRYLATRQQMAHHLRRNRRQRDALAVYLDAWYLSLNGPRNCGDLGGARLGTEDPSFDPSRSISDPALQRQILSLISHLGIDLGTVQMLYFDATTPTWRSLALPLTPKMAWLQIGPDLLPKRERRLWAAR